jgi:hypothetical protein
MTTFTTYATPGNVRAVLGPRPGGELRWSGGGKGPRCGEMVGILPAASRCRTSQSCQRVLVSDQRHAPAKVEVPS